MLTKDDVGAVRDFSTLPPALIERLAQRSADIRLSAGEYAVSEGAEA